MIERLKSDANVLTVHHIVTQKLLDQKLGADPRGRRQILISLYSMMLATTPAPTVRPPSRIAKRRP
jgi:hypothetical protein